MPVGERGVGRVGADDAAGAGCSASSKPAYPRIWSLSVIATAMAAVDGSSSRQMRLRGLASPCRPSCRSSVWLARRSMASDWRARTESGSMSSRMTMTMREREHDACAYDDCTAMLRYGDTRWTRCSTRPDSTVDREHEHLEREEARQRRSSPSSPVAPAARRTSSSWLKAPCLPASGAQCTPVCPSTPTSFSTSTTAATIRKPPKTKRSVRSGTSRTRRAPMTAPGMEPTATAMPAA